MVTKPSSFAFAAIVLLVVVNLVHGADDKLDCQAGKKLNNMNKDCCATKLPAFSVFTEQQLITCSNYADTKKPVTKFKKGSDIWVHSFQANMLLEKMGSKITANQTIAFENKKTMEMLCKNRNAEFVACLFKNANLTYDGQIDVDAIAEFYNNTLGALKFNMTNFTAMILHTEFEAQFNLTALNISCVEKKDAAPRYVSLMPLIVAQLAQAHVLAACPAPLTTSSAVKKCAALPNLLNVCTAKLWYSLTQGAPPLVIDPARVAYRKRLVK